MVREPDMKSAKPVQATGERLQGVIDAIATIEHYLNNDLAVTVAYCELMAANPDLTEDVRFQACKALERARAASSSLRKLRQVTSLEPDSTLRGMRILNLNLTPSDLAGLDAQMA